MNWKVEYLKEAKQDLNHLDGSVRKQVATKIHKVSENPLSQSQGGYGKPLGNQGDINLTNYMKIKFAKIGIRVVYKLQFTDEIMTVVIISVREDKAVYKEAVKRIKKYGL